MYGSSFPKSSEKTLKRWIQVHFQQIEFNSLIQKIDNPPYEWDAIMLGLTARGAPYGQKRLAFHRFAPYVEPRQPKPVHSVGSRVSTALRCGKSRNLTNKTQGAVRPLAGIGGRTIALIYTVLPEQIFCIANKFGNINPAPNGGILHNISGYRLQQAHGPHARRLLRRTLISCPSFCCDVHHVPFYQHGARRHSGQIPVRPAYSPASVKKSSTSSIRRPSWCSTATARAAVHGDLVIHFPEKQAFLP